MVQPINGTFEPSVPVAEALFPNMAVDTTRVRDSDMARLNWIPMPDTGTYDLDQLRRMTEGLKKTQPAPRQMR